MHVHGPYGYPGWCYNAAQMKGVCTYAWVRGAAAMGYIIQGAGCRMHMQVGMQGELVMLKVYVEFQEIMTAPPRAVHQT